METWEHLVKPGKILNPIKKSKKNGNTRQKRMKISMKFRKPCKNGNTKKNSKWKPGKTR